MVFASCGLLLLGCKYFKRVNFSFLSGIASRRLHILHNGPLSEWANAVSESD